MFLKDDEKYLIGALGRAEVLLFLGAGFSSEAKNKLGVNLPVGNKLAQEIWQYLGYKSDYNYENLQVMSQALLSSGRPYSEISEFLSTHLTATVVPSDYDNICKPFWFKIYTSNIDNVVSEAYRRSTNNKLRVLSYPYDNPVDRDQFLEKIQMVHLNGRLFNGKELCKPDEIIFSTIQYAQSHIKHNPLYEQYARECAIHPTIFVGTTLEEPLFWEYLAARKDRAPRTKEFRDRSFVISIKISEANRKFLKEEYNIIGIEGTVIEFLAWLQKISVDLPDRMEVLKNTIPNIVDYFKVTGYNALQKEINEFAQAFQSVSIPVKIGSYRSLYLLGTTPKWEDLFRNLDAPRKITNDIFNGVESSFTSHEDLNIFAILGTAGCGKSTILKRLGIFLLQSGKKIYYTDSETLPSPNTLYEVIKTINEKIILMFDNAEIILGILPTIIKELERLSKPPIIILSSRTNEFSRLTSRYKSIIELKEFYVPMKLDTDEIISIIDILEKSNLPGKLRGMTRKQQIVEFESRASKQILVAMREATSGHGFDEIIEDEFKKIVPEEAKILCLCVALATDAGYSITKETFIGLSTDAPANTLNILKITLQDIVIEDEVESNKISLRHRAIAKYIIDTYSSRDHLKSAYVRILDSLSILIIGRPWRDSVCGLYRDLINHKTIYTRFGKKINEVREVYDAVKDNFSYEFHFWLQYACLEIEANGGDLIIAENYLNQAESLKKDEPYGITARGHLLLKKGVKARNKMQALEYREQGSEILLKMIEVRGGEDAYAYHIYCHQIYNWIHIWAIDDDEKRKELTALIEVCKRGFKLHPKNKKLEDILDKLTRALYNLAVDISTRPDDPIISVD